MKVPRNLLQYAFIRNRFTSTTTTTSVSSARTSTSETSISNTNFISKDTEKDNESSVDLRQRVAPWITAGTFQKGLLSHLSTLDIIRALFVLKICSYDFVVDRSLQMFELSQKFGAFGNWILRRTFFNQFVGGDTKPRMAEVVQSLQKRGLILMVQPVLEEDIEDAKSSNKKYDGNLNTLLDVASMTSFLDSRKPILQLKMTAIMPATTLEKVSRAIESRNIGRENIGIPTTMIVSEIANCIENPDGLKLNVDSIDRVHFIEGFKRADYLAKRCVDLKVNILVDAEFYACKPGISAIALALMVRYNRHSPVIGNTIQGYLKDAIPTVNAELELIEQEIGVNWYGKIVRGAYVDRERYLAKKNGYSSPICDTYAETSISYNQAVQQVLYHLANKSGGNKKTHLVVATHNEKSIRLAAQTMKDLEILPSDQAVSFAQIYGMADYLSTPLVQNGYRVYKSTPYGPINSVMPYLSRRASENRSVVKGAREERYMLWAELKARMART